MTTMKKSELKKQSYYDVKVESMIPATLTFRVLAESAEQAASLLDRKHPIAVNYKLAGRRDKKITVYDIYECVIKFVKSL